ncbi:MAG: hypothetical protein WBM55_00945 [Muriicola sp.]
MRKCVLLFLLLVFVLIIASITENNDRAASAEKVAMEVNDQNSLAQESTAGSNELAK